MIIDSLKELEKSGKLDKPVVLWGINNITKEVITWLRLKGYGDKLLFIVDNFKYTFCHEYEGLVVVTPARLKELEKESVSVMFFTMKHQESVRKQIEA